MSEMDDKVLELWGKGHTAGQIAAFFRISRNAVMGRIHRMRAKNKIGYRVLPGTQKKPKKSRPASITQGGNRMASKKLAKQKSEPPPLPLFQEPLPILEKRNYPTIIELKTYDCRYIVKEHPQRGNLYCGAPQTRSSYCEQHAKLCFLPTRYKIDIAAESANPY